MTELEKLFQEKGLKVCPICGMPFDPYHRRQRTCGDARCMRLWKNAYLRNRTKELREQDLEGWRKYHREAQRKYRAKLQELKRAEQELDTLREYAQRQEKFDKFVTEHGHEYGKYSAAKVLATVPKIDVNLEKKDEEEV